MFLRHPVVEGYHPIARRPLGTRIVKGSHHGRVAPLDDAHNAAHAASVGLGRLDLHQHLVALHGAVDLVGGNKNVFHHTRALPRVGAHKPVAVAVQIEPPRHQVLSRSRPLGNAPMLAVHLGQQAVFRQPGQLLQQQSPGPSAAQLQVPRQVFVSGLLTGRAGNSSH